jgi:hypothetical protein
MAGQQSRDELRVASDEVLLDAVKAIWKSPVGRRTRAAARHAFVVHARRFTFPDARFIATRFVAARGRSSVEHAPRYRRDPAPADHVRRHAETLSPAP